MGLDGTYGKFIEVENDEMLPNILILFGVLILYLIIIIMSKWRLFSLVGWIFIGLYIIYALYNVVFVWLLDIYNT